jgi:hypothetical protein
MISMQDPIPSATRGTQLLSLQNPKASTDFYLHQHSIAQRRKMWYFKGHVDIKTTDELIDTEPREMKFSF